MKRFAYPLVILAACLPFQAQAADNPSPSLLAKIQLATQAHQDSRAAGREFKDMTKFARENAPAQDGVSGDVQSKKVGSLNVSKMLPQGSHKPAAIGKAIGSHANDGDED